MTSGYKINRFPGRLQKVNIEYVLLAESSLDFSFVQIVTLRCERDTGAIEREGDEQGRP